MVKIKELLAHPSNYGNKRLLSNIKYIVVHYTANDGDSDEGNANYFRQDLRANGKKVASAHYFVDDDSITRSVKDDFIAYSVGGDPYTNCKQTGGGKWYGKCRNDNSISVEMCDTQKDGTVKATKTTINNTIDLIKELMKKYDVPVENVIRHFDVTGKPCPSYFVDEASWLAFKNDLVEKKSNEKKYRAIKDAYLRTSPEVCKNKIMYCELSATVKKKCYQDKNGYAVFKAGNTFTCVDSKTDKDGNKWKQMKSGHWFPAIYDDVRRAEKI